MSGEIGETRTFRANRGDAGRRLDHVLLERLAGVPGVSRTRLQAWIDEGRVRVEARRAERASSRVPLAAEIAIRLPVELARGPRRPPAPESIPLDVVYEDEHLLLVDKPAGLVVHPSYRHPDGTLLNGLMRRLGESAEPPRLVSRLDKLTSGLLLVARTAAVHGVLAGLQRRGGIQKDYLALVYGDPPAAKDTISLPLGRDPHDRRRVCVTDDGRPSATGYERLGVSSGPRRGVTLLRCRLHTGRMHQIRVHLSASGWPLVGDPAYGGPGWKGVADAALADLLRDFPRQALHAWRVAFRHPITGRAVDVRTDPPADLLELLAAAGLAVPTEPCPDMQIQGPGGDLTGADSPV